MRATRLCAVLLSLACAHVALAQEDDAKRKEAEARLKELNARAEQLYGQGKYADARATAEESLALAEKALGPEHPATATSLNNLAEVLEAMVDLKGARPLFERALAIREKALGPEHPDTVTSLNTLALLLQAMGDLKGARPLFERALAICEKALGPEHRYTAGSLNNLALLLKAMGDLKGARPLFERALAICEKTRGPEHPDTAHCINNLAALLQAMGDLKGARPLYERALAIYEKALGPEHPHTASSLNNLAFLLKAMGDLKGARPLYERALAIYEKALGPEHPETAPCLNNLAALLQAMGDLKGARPLFERALAIWEKALGPEHPRTATSLNNLAGLLKDMGDLKGARPLYERALAIFEKALGSEHPLTATSLDNLAGLLQAMGDLKGARPLIERALAISEKALGPEHPDTATSLNNLAALLHAMGDLAGARPLYERAWGVNRKDVHTLLPAMSSDQRRSLLSTRAYQLADFLSGLRDEAGETYEAALAWKGAALRASAVAERLPDDAPAEVREAAARLADARRALAALYYGGKQPKPGEPSIREQAETLQREIDAGERLLGEKAPGFAARTFRDAPLDDVRKALPEGAALLDVLENCGNVHAWVVRREGEVRYFDLGKASEIEPLAGRLREALENDDEKGWREAGAALREKLAKPLDAALDGRPQGAPLQLLISPDGALGTIPWGLLPEGDGFLIERLPIVQVHGGAGLVMAARTAGEKRGEGLLAIGDVDYSGIEGGPPRLPATKAEVEEVAALFKGASHVLTRKEATKAAFSREAPKARYVHVATHGFFDLEHLRAATTATRGFAGELHSEPIGGAGERKEAGGWNPLLLSGIVLAADDPASLPRASGASRGGWLTAEELQSLDLRGVDLVVLSACETGRGELAAGEGVLGLSRALAIAGARGFMLSLWKVPDEQTRKLMDGFYAGLWGERAAGCPPQRAGAAPTVEEALRSTQLRMLARDREAKAFRPSTWGAWVLLR